ncbi:MAG: hypothetical protein OER88_09185, partial [Planctomycetota bacterium]|nr:hypothetical protein [Planctomycetota bacterium]
MRLLFSLPVCLCLAAAVQAGDVEDVIFRARHAQLVDADFKQAIALYLEALGDSSLKEDRQADLHLRVARCYAGLGQPRRALDPHLVKSIYEKASKAVRSDADALRLRLRDRIATPKPDRDPELDAKSVRERRRARLAQHVAQARRFLETGEEAGALHQVLLALAIDASHAEAQALQATIERRIRGSSEFLRDPLKALRSWTKARVAQVAQHASTRLTEGIGFARKGSYNLAHARFEEAVRLIDACALRSDAERLDELRRRVLGHWRELRKRELGPDKAEPPIPDAPPPEDSLVREYLNTLQRLLDVVSGPEREYRIVPVRGASGRRADRSWQSKPRRFALFDHQPTSWTAARFAKHVVLARVSPESWARSGNYLDASGEMLVLSNKPDVLDAAVREVERLEQPAVTSVRGRFVLVAVTDAMLKAFEERFGRFRRSLRGDSPVAFRALPQSEFSFEYLASLLRKLGADVNLPGDLFEVELANGSGRRLFCARPVTDVDGYANFSGTGKPVADTHFGVMLDVFALRGAKQQTAFGLRVVTRAPAPPFAAGGDDLVARFDTQTAELFAD